MQGKYLITTDNWFIAPDGKEYKAVWGNVEILEDKFLGVATNRNSSNWFAKVGSEQTHIIVAGCQIHYAARCKDKPNTGKVESWTTGENGCKEFQTPTRIYIAE
jgi:hypothetical protein